MTQREPSKKQLYNERFMEYRRILNRYPSIYEPVKSVREQMPLKSADRLYLYVFIPALTGFVSWVLKEAQAAGHKKLYFLSRDGYQMFLIARELIKSEGYDIRCRYLNVSRYSMRVPGYHLDMDKAFEQICVGGIDVTLRKILKRAALNDKETEQIIAELGAQAKADAILDNAGIAKYKDILKANKNLEKFIYDHSKAACDNAMGYLERKGLFKSGKAVVVDSGWIGTLQQSIETLLRQKNDKIRLEGYYFGMYETPPGADEKNFHAWYFSHNSGLERKVRFSNSLFEAIVTSDEGMTTGYKQKDGKVVPVGKPSARPDEQIKNNIEVLKKFLSVYKGTELKNSDFLELSEKLFSKFMSAPTMLEVSCYGDEMFSDDIREDTLKKVAADLTDEQIKDQRLLNKVLKNLGVKDNTIHESAWIEGSIVRNGTDVEASLKHVRRYKYVVYKRKEVNNSKGISENEAALENKAPVKAKQVQKEKTADIKPVETDEYATIQDVPKERPGEEPVISVKDVSMQFNIMTNNVSGIKDYFVQKVKHKINHRKFMALENISFDVYKSEVVGIIGTNGSGKSTLLKIVSGALSPTSGKVSVDRSKIQLLTLGTGFDMELTAKENVYLNGAIIGYTKEFIDRHYDDIVDFAELHGFMEEKVKNFSSGMVSRLGFAIATAANAAEILILDEVLSVGDEFFRKKSLARIKEMIHGGSTVLIVSHNMGTIKEHCDRVVWIEKSKLRMIGEPKEVCAAYSSMDGTQAQG